MTAPRFLLCPYVFLFLKVLAALQTCDGGLWNSLLSPSPGPQNVLATAYFCLSQPAMTLGHEMTTSHSLIPLPQGVGLN